MSIELIIPFFNIFRDENLPLWLSLGIISFGLFFFVLYYFHVYSPIRRSLRKASRSLERIHGYTQFHDQSSTLDVIFTDSGLKHSWDEFKQTLIFPGQYDREKIIRHTIRPQKYFNFESLAYRYNISLYQALPNIIVGFGLLLTFCGLVSAIYLTGESIISQHSSDVVAHTGNLKNALDSLLKVAAFKFLTSIAGLITSLILTLEIRICNGKLRNEYNTLNTHLERNLLFVSHEQLLSRQHEISLQQLESFQNHSASLQKFTADIAKENAQKTALAINAIIKMYLTHAKTSVDPILELFAGKIENATKATMTHLVREFSSMLRAETRSEMQALTASLKHSQEALNQLSLTLNNAGQTIDGAILSSASTLQDSLNQLGLALDKQARTTIGSLEKSLNQSMTGLEQKILAATDKFDLAGGKLETNLLSAAQVVQTAFTEAATNLTTNAQKQTKLFSENFQAAAKDFNESLMNEASSLNEAAQTLLANTKEAQESFSQNCAKYLEEIKSTGQTQSNLLIGAATLAAKTLNEQAALSSENLQAVEESVTQALKAALDNANMAFEKLNEQRSVTLAEQEKLYQTTLFQAAERLEHSAQKVAEEFKFVQENLSQSLNISEEATVKSLRALGAELHKNLLSSSEFLQNNMEQYAQNLASANQDTVKHLSDIETVVCGTISASADTFKATCAEIERTIEQMRSLQEVWLKETLSEINAKVTDSLAQVKSETENLEDRLTQVLATSSESFGHVLEKFAEKNSLALDEDTKVIQTALEKTHNSFQLTMEKTQQTWSNSLKKLLAAFKGKPEEIEGKVEGKELPKNASSDYSLTQLDKQKKSEVENMDNLSEANSSSNESSKEKNKRR